MLQFSTLYKRNGSLYLLVTDVGFAGDAGSSGTRRSRVVWESMVDVDGAGSEYHDGHFIPLNSSPTTLPSSSPPSSQSPQVSSDPSINAQEGGGGDDYALALQIHQEEMDRARQRQEAERSRSRAHHAHRPREGEGEGNGSSPPPRTSSRSRRGGGDGKCRVM